MRGFCYRQFILRLEKAAGDFQTCWFSVTLGLAKNRGPSIKVARFTDNLEIGEGAAIKAGSSGA